ncbi:MAG: hypothetical protein QM762_13810 [Chryseolinea sp.]
MSYIDRYSRICKRFYMTILGLTIPFYLLLYGASGHQFDPPQEDIIWIGVVIVAFVVELSYASLKVKAGPTFNLLRVLFLITLIATAYGGLKAFLSMLEFDFDDEVSFIIRGLFYGIPLVFVLSTLVISIGLFGRRVE